MISSKDAQVVLVSIIIVGRTLYQLLYHGFANATRTADD